MNKKNKPDINPNRPNIITRFNLPDYRVPVRAYLHGAGFEIWGEQSVSTDPIEVAKDYLFKTLDSLGRRIASFDYVLAFMWGQFDPEGQDKEGHRVIDCFGYSGVPKLQKDWPGNSDGEGWVMKDGLYVKKEDITLAGLTCEDCDIIKGKEGEYRRTCKNLNEFIRNPPKIQGLEYLTRVSE
jgi:hypothetical protein